MTKRPTIRDIAEAANVSKSTVSRVLNGSSAVHPDKKKAVEEASERLGFRPNFLAQSLANGKSMTIGVMTQIIGSPFYDTISQGVVKGFQKTGYSPIFVDGQWDEETESEAIRALIGRCVDGLILIGGDIPSDKLNKLCGQIPTVVVARRIPDMHRNCFMVDNVKGGYIATKHLIDCGHRDIAIIRGLSHHADAIDRFTGYKNALEEAGIELNPELVLDGDFSMESGLAAMDSLLEKGITCTALFGSNDNLAFGARLSLHQKNIRVPEDFSIIGFDDQAETAFMIPPMTTIRQPAMELGNLSAKAILKLLQGEDVESLTLDGTLQIRQSVASPPENSS